MKKKFFVIQISEIYGRRARKPNNQSSMALV